MIKYKNNEDITLTILILLGELIILNVIIYSLRHFLPTDNMMDIFHYKRVHGMLTLLYIICNRYSGSEVHGRFAYGFSILRNVLLNQFLFVCGTSVLIYATAPELFVWWMSFVHLAILTIVMSLYRKMVRIIIQYCRSHRQTPYNVVFLSDNTSNVEHFIMRMHRDKNIGYTVAGYFANEINPKLQELGLRYIGTPDTFAQWYKNTEATIKMLYITLDPVWTEMLYNEVFPLCEQKMCLVKVIPGFLPYEQATMAIHMEGDYPVFDMRNNPLMMEGNKITKRIFDLVASSLFLITIFPIIYLIFGLLIKLSSPGPVFFKQKRSGLDGKEFEMYKFRSMRVNTDSDTKQATKEDNRKTKIGNFMRRTSIDELPQFINVFLGDMSIVGPRPHMVLHTNQYSGLVDHYMVRHFVKPGITGYAQITGFRGETDELWKMEGRVDADIWYLEHWSIILDVWIIMRTVFRMKDAHAY